jgi:hypothetical protein
MRRAGVTTIFPDAVPKPSPLVPQPTQPSASSSAATGTSADGVSTLSSSSASSASEAIVRPSAAARRLATDTGLAPDEAEVAVEILGKGSAKPLGAGQHTFTERNLAGLWGRRTEGLQLPEGIVEQTSGYFRAFEVKNQIHPDVGGAVAKFRTLAQLSRNATVGGRTIRIDRFDLFVNRRTFRGFDDANYSIGKNNVLQRMGQDVVVDGRKVYVRFRDLPDQR